MMQDFYAQEELEISRQFLRDKYLITPAEDMNALHAIRKKIAQETAAALQITLAEDGGSRCFPE